jgi:hypothetical protein
VGGGGGAAGGGACGCGCPGGARTAWAAEDNEGTAAREEEADMAAWLESARKPRASWWRRRMKETKAEGEKK